MRRRGDGATEKPSGRVIKQARTDGGEGETVNGKRGKERRSRVKKAFVARKAARKTGKRLGCKRFWEMMIVARRRG